MALFAVTLNDQTIDFVDDADAYQQEGPLTTFFSFSGGRQVVDSWSVRLASYRTADIAAIRRSRPEPAPLDRATDHLADNQADRLAEHSSPVLAS